MSFKNFTWQGDEIGNIQSIQDMAFKNFTWQGDDEISYIKSSCISFNRSLKLSVVASISNIQLDPFKEFNSSVKWTAVASIISSVIGAVALVAIVLAIIDCLKKAGSAILAYTLILNNSSTSATTSESVKLTIEPDYQFETVEGCIADVAKEKPIAFSAKQLEDFTGNYTILLGSGSFGVVYKGEFPNGKKIAVKVLRNNSAKNQFMAEVSTLGRTNHINLVKLYGFCFDTNMKALVYEYMENGSLDRFLFDDNNTIEWEKLHDIAVGTARGIAYLHHECRNRIIHYDLKPTNILLDSCFIPKVADFGLAKLCNENSRTTMIVVRGTVGYAAPELNMPCPPTQKSDVYSFGMLLFEIIARRRNHDATSETREWLPRWGWESFEKGQLVEMMEICGIEEKDREKAERLLMVALRCVQYLPDERPVMGTVVQWLEGQNISPPPNPFAYLDSFDSDSSWFPPSKCKTSSEISFSVPLKRIFEIEGSSSEVNQSSL